MREYFQISKHNIVDPHRSMEILNKIMDVQYPIYLETREYLDNAISSTYFIPEEKYNILRKRTRTIFPPSPPF